MDELKSHVIDLEDANYPLKQRIRELESEICKKDVKLKNLMDVI